MSLILLQEFKLTQKDKSTMVNIGLIMKALTMKVLRYLIPVTQGKEGDNELRFKKVMSDHVVTDS
jgi:hypothetical protein